MSRPAAPGDLVAVDLAALGAEPPALRALVLHDLLREAMGGDALVERRLVEALLRLATAHRRRRPGRASAAGWRRCAARGVLRIRAVAGRARVRVGGRRRRGPRRRPARPALTSRFCGRAWRLRLLPGAALDRDAALAGEAFAGLAGSPRGE